MDKYKSKVERKSPPVVAEAAKFQPTDEVIEDFLEPLTDFHSQISAFAIKNSDNFLQLAIERIAQALTALSQRNRTRHSSGDFGKEKN